jgi:hypothetical protein
VDEDLLNRSQQKLSLQRTNVPCQEGAGRIGACPLCHGEDSALIHTDGTREYRRCGACALIFADAGSLPTPAAERERYLLHSNRADEEGYLRHLRQLADPVMARVEPGSKGLDFGCGHTQVMAQILAQNGFPTCSYDPFFFPDLALLQRRYQFITCCEVMEHVHRTAEVFALFRELCVPGGTLAVMTRFYESANSFATWWYRRDPTHVRFFNEETMRWVASSAGWRVEFPAPNVTLFAAP